MSQLEGGYVVPEAAQIAVRNLRTAQASGDYKEVGTARRFAESLTSDLRSATHDKHIAVFFDPEPATSTNTTSSTPPVKARERFNFGFYKIERLRGNIGYQNKTVDVWTSQNVPGRRSVGQDLYIS